MQQLQQALGYAVPALVMVVSVFASGGVMVPFLWATSRLRVRTVDGVVRVSGIDPKATAVAMLALPSIAAGSFAWGHRVAAGVTLLALLGILGCRVHVRVRRDRTWVARTFLFVVPWRWQRMVMPPQAFVDGWGDFADPASLNLDLGAEGGPIVLGWGGQNMPSSDTLARVINEAIESVSKA